MTSETRRRTVYRRKHVRRRRYAVVVAFAALAVLISVVTTGGGRGLGLSGGGAGRDVVTYDRSAAAAYADTWALSNNPAIWHSDTSDCANFVSQCVQAGGLRPLADPGLEWHDNGAEFPAVSWVNCGAQLTTFTTGTASHTAYIAETSDTLPFDWAAGDIVYLGNVVKGKTEWQHVIICVGKKGGRWVYDSHTEPHRRQPLSRFYPGHDLALIRFCHLADRVEYK